MNITYGEAVSRVLNGLNTIHKDTRIPKRYVLSVLKQMGSFLLSQKMRDKSIYRETDLFTWVNCIELKNDDIIKCPIFEFKRCESLMRSKKKIPKIITSKYGHAVLMVTSVDNNRKFDIVTLSNYISMKNRRDFNKFKGKYAIIQDDYIYIPDSDIELINMFVLTLDEDYEECSSCKENSKCKSVWDMKFPLSDSILNTVILDTRTEVSMRLQIPTDANPNLDPNQISATT